MHPETIIEVVAGIADRLVLGGALASVKASGEPDKDRGSSLGTAIESLGPQDHSEPRSGRSTVKR